MISSFYGINNGGGGSGMTPAEVLELIAASGAPILVQYSEITTSKGIEIYNAPEKYVIQDEDKIYLYAFQTRSAASYYYEENVFFPEDGTIAVERNEIDVFNNGHTFKTTENALTYDKNKIDELLPEGGDYLPLSGGTLTGEIHLGTSANTLTIPLIFYRKVSSKVHKVTMQNQNTGDACMKHFTNDTEDSYFLLDGTGMRIRYSGENGKSVTTDSTRYVVDIKQKNVGDTYHPVFISGNTAVECDYFIRGSRGAFGTVPFIHPDGVMEIGRYIDFHSDSADTSDYSLRVQTNNYCLTQRTSNRIFPVLAEDENVDVVSKTVGAIWTGTKAQYNAITTKDSHTLYITTN